MPIRVKLSPFQLIALFLLIVIGFVVFGVYYYHSQKHQIVDSYKVQISAIADLKVEQIHDWRHYQVDKAMYLHRGTLIPRLLDRALNDPNSWEAVNLSAFFKTNKNNLNVEEVFVSDPLGRLRHSTAEADAILTEVLETSAALAIKEKKPVFSRLFYSPTTRSIRIIVSFPALMAERGDEVTGVVSVLIDPYQKLFPLIQTWPTPSSSGEVLMVSREGNYVVFLNELRHQKDTALRLRFDISSSQNLLAARAVQGEKVVIEGIDYRGVPVLGALRSIPESPWFIVAKVDMAEVLASLSERMQVAVSLIVVLILLIGTVMYGLFLGNKFQTLRDAELAARLRSEELEQAVLSRTQELQSSLAVVEEESAEREKAERSLQEANLELVAANKELEAFSYSISHDLRAPVRSIDGFCRILIEDYGDKLDAAAMDSLNRVRVAAAKMGKLIEDLLQLARIGRIEASSGFVDLSRMAEGIIAECRQANPERQVEVQIEPGISVPGDEGLLKVMMTNLLENAWKFTGKKPTAVIEFGVVMKDARQTYFIRDNGAGFNMDYADKLFAPFQRLHSDKEFSGTGIGLAIVARIVRKHGGKVWAEGAVGQGAVVYFTLGEPVRG